MSTKGTKQNNFAQTARLETLREIQGQKMKFRHTSRAKFQNAHYIRIDDEEYIKVGPTGSTQLDAPQDSIPLHSNPNGIKRQRHPDPASDSLTPWSGRYLRNPRINTLFRFWISVSICASFLSLSLSLSLSLLWAASQICPVSRFVQNRPLWFALIMQSLCCVFLLLFVIEYVCWCVDRSWFRNEFIVDLFFILLFRFWLSKLGLDFGFRSDIVLLFLVGNGFVTRILIVPCCRFACRFVDLDLWFENFREYWSCLNFFCGFGLGIGWEIGCKRTKLFDWLLVLWKKKV